MDQAQKEKVYRIYVTDTLWGLAHGRGLETRYRDLFQKEVQETRTAEEIVQHIKSKLAAV
ncbi:hypothetical protein D1159_03885 [Pseudoflavonifractor sp. 524-17]|nr:hypothetical protein [Pseudoflavonifractor sp. 524-17]